MLVNETPFADNDVMTILAIADRPPKTPIKITLATQPIDLICTLGDLDLFSLRELEDITTIPKFGVYGNHCSGTYFDDLGIKNMHLQIFKYQGWIFGGFEGSIRYKNSQTAKMYSQEEANELLNNFPPVDVMLAHSPPYGLNDDPRELPHTGLIALRTYIEQKKPKYFLHGHTYPSEQELITHYRETKIIYVFQDKIIELA